MQEFVYTFYTEEDFGVVDDSFLELLEAVVEDEFGCKLIRSKLEFPGEVISKGDWEDEDLAGNDTFSDSHDDQLRDIGEKFMELRNTVRKMHFGNRTMEDTKKAAQNMSEVCMKFIKSIELKGESKDE